MTKRGTLDNIVTYEHYCDTKSDLNNIPKEYSTLGSIAIVIQDENDELNAYIANTKRQWVPLFDGESGEVSNLGITYHICGSEEISSVGFPNIEDPDKNTFYLTPSISSGENNLYTEWFYSDDKWEKFGDGGSNFTDLLIDWEISSAGEVGYIANKPAIYAGTGEFSIVEAIGNEASGALSHAEGYNTKATSYQSHSEGASTIASDAQAHAEGYATQASGAQAHAEGFQSVASGIQSHAEGSNTTASNMQAHAEGYKTIAHGVASHAEGTSDGTQKTITPAGRTFTFTPGANGAYSHTEGSNTGAIEFTGHAEGNLTFAIGQMSHVEGYSTVATGNASHAEGYATAATDTYAHAEGNNTLASAPQAHSEGCNTIARGYASHAEGTNTIAKNESQHVFGAYNVEDPSSAAVSLRGTYVEIVGNGNITTRSNARTLDWAGNEWLAGNLSLASGKTLTIGSTTLTEHALQELLSFTVASGVSF